MDNKDSETEGNDIGPPSKKAKISKVDNNDDKSINKKAKEKNTGVANKSKLSDTLKLKRPSSGDALGATSSPSVCPKKRKLEITTDSSSAAADGSNSKMGKQHSVEEIEKKKCRMKKSKALLKAVEEQMEFYFSDSNLSKDRFLRRLYDESDDGYVGLSEFKNFNKLQELMKDKNFDKVLYKALAGSSFFEVNKDGNKVRRKTPFVEVDQEEIDKRTVYVEHLPSHASHAWLRKIFSRSGKVCYVSLPVYQTTKQIKGFAFVEFHTAEEAQKACEILNNPLPTKTEEKPGKFPKGNKFLYRVQKIAPGIKPDERDSNEENLQSYSKEDQTVAAVPKKKKKKSSKRKSDVEDSIDESEKIVPEQNEGGHEEKKKRKKRKRKSSETETNPKEELEDVESVRENDKAAERTSVDSTQNNAEKDKLNEIRKIEKEKSEENYEDMDKETKKKLKKKNRKKLSKLKKQLGDSNNDTDIVRDDNDKEKTNAKEIEDHESKSKISKKELEEITKEVTDEKSSSTEVKLSRKERKQLRQEDIRKKKAEKGNNCESDSKEEENKKNKNKENLSIKIEPENRVEESTSQNTSDNLNLKSEKSNAEDCNDDVSKKSDGSQLTSCLSKPKKQDAVSTKKVEFDPVPITTEFVERKEVRKRKKQKRETLHLRVISKEKWLSLRGEYIRHQKSHMAALKESLRDLRMKENMNQSNDPSCNKHVDLTNVFGTKRMKPSDDVKLAHLEELKFIPNVIVQWKCSHEINRSKIKNMFPQISSDKIAYVDGQEEAKCGYIRFNDEASAEEFAKLSRSSQSSFSARVLPESQQASYWEKANADRKEKLSKKKNERGSQKIARKVVERNKATFHEKGSRIVFDDNDDNDNADELEAKNKINKDDDGAVKEDS